jgi:hypothetical protein
VGASGTTHGTAPGAVPCTARDAAAAKPRRASAGRRNREGRPGRAPPPPQTARLYFDGPSIGAPLSRQARQPPAMECTFR